ncbi:MAG TPA: ribosomal protein L16 [Flavobacterium sp.]|nr:ribosomal protein L16 [Flavobacterium sp.]
MLQAILKKQDRYNVRTRVRKFKSRVLKNHVVKFSNRGKGQHLVTGLDRYILRADQSCIVAFKALVGGEKALMYSKGAIEPVYRGYPKFFITAKSSKSRMGKGKGKLGGRIQKVKKNEAMFEFDIGAPHRSANFLRAFKSALPVTVSMIAPVSPALSVINEVYRWRRTFNFDLLVASGKKARRQKFILARQKKTVKMNAAKRRKRNRRRFFIHRRTNSTVIKLNMLYNSIFPYRRRNLTK